MKRLTQLLALLITLMSCDGNYEYVRFETAQPEGVKPRMSFDRKTQATYYDCTNPDAQLIIRNNVILSIQTIKFQSHRLDIELDSTDLIDIQNDNQIIKLIEEDGFTVNIVGDTIFAKLTEIDTIFQISENQVLKKMKGSYFLNYKNSENQWKVKRINIDKDSLFIGQIYPSDTLLRFDFISVNQEFDEKDSITSTEYIANPTRRELKKLIKHNSFDRTSCYCNRNKKGDNIL